MWRLNVDPDSGVVTLILGGEEKPKKGLAGMQEIGARLHAASVQEGIAAVPVAGFWSEGRAFNSVPVVGTAVDTRPMIGEARGNQPDRDLPGCRIDPGYVTAPVST